MIVLGIETSCDDTSVAVIENNKVLSNIIARQIIHEEYKGVVPELASREHLRLINKTLTEALKVAGKNIEEIEAIAVTYAPGLIGAVLVGVNYAKGLAQSLNVPFVGVNHMEGHIAANYLSNAEWKPPYITLVVSGGHTMLVHVKDFFDFEILGNSLDDAIGEAFDKVAKLMDLGYPGGPIIDKRAQSGDENAIKFPVPYIKNNNLNFSYSGLKTAVLNYLKKNENYNIDDVSASFQKAAIEALLVKMKRASKKLGLERVAIAGGVSANSYLRRKISDLCGHGYEINIPELAFCTDNAAMIAKAGEIRLKNGFRSNFSLKAKPVLSLEKTYAYE